MRKQTVERARSLALANSFRGLNPRFSRWTLCDDIEKARVPLGLDSDCLWLFRFLTRRTADQDWRPGAEPIVAWSRFEIMAESGWSEDKLGRVENKLCDAGLIAFRDAPNFKRYAYRGADGALPASATGISLAPAGARAAEISAMAHHHQEDIRKLSALFADAFRLRADLAGLKGLDGLPGAMAAAADEVYRLLPCRRDSSTALASLIAIVARARQALAALKAFLGYDDTLPAQADRAAVTEPPSRPRPSDDPHPGRSSSVASMRPQIRTDAEQKTPESKNKDSDQEILRVLSASPGLFQAYIEAERGPALTPDRVIQRATERYATDLDLAPSTVGRLWKTYGMATAMKALFSLGKMLENGAEIRNPTGYAFSIAARSTAPQLRSRRYA